jgi:hypothetical protein
MAPLAKFDLFGHELGLVFAFLIGAGFGAALEMGGLGNARKLAAQFYFRDLTVFKVMFTGIVTAMVLILLFGQLGWMDLSKLYINPTYWWPQIVGGLVLGFGFIIGGYCPGTSVVAASTGKIDGMLFLVGAMVGMAVFGLAFPLIEPLFMAGHMEGSPTVPSFLGVRPGLVALVMVVVALAGFVAAEWAERRFGDGPVQP